jgi:hypothetical protein
VKNAEDDQFDNGGLFPQFPCGFSVSSPIKHTSIPIMKVENSLGNQETLETEKPGNHRNHLYIKILIYLIHRFRLLIII